MKPIDLLNKVLATEAQCHPLTQVDQTPSNHCVKPVIFHRVDDTVKNRAKVPKWHIAQLHQWVKNSVLLEWQTGVPIPAPLEAQLNAAVTRGDLDAGYAATRAIRDHLAHP